MENLEIRRIPGNGSDVSILRIQGPLTLATLFDFQNAVRQPDLRNTILDLTEVPYIDSAGLGVILSHWAHTQRVGNKFAVVGVSERVKVLLDMTKVSALLPSFATAQEAERRFADTTSAASG
jgi:anti-anti-sigma factor